MKAVSYLDGGQPDSEKKIVCLAEKIQIYCVLKIHSVMNGFLLPRHVAPDGSVTLGCEALSLSEG